MELIRLLKPDWYFVPAMKNFIPPNKIGCPSCEELHLRMQDSHELIVNLVNKGNDIQRQLFESQEKEIQLSEETKVLTEKIEKYDYVVNDYENCLKVAMKEIEELKTERDQLKENRKFLENALFDINDKLEEAKTTIEQDKKNESILWSTIKEAERVLVDTQQKYNDLKEETNRLLEAAKKSYQILQEECKEVKYKDKTVIKTLEEQVESLSNILQDSALETECDNFTKDQFDQTNQLNQWTELNQLDQLNQLNQLNQLDQMDHMDQMNEIDQNDEIDDM